MSLFSRLFGGENNALDDKVKELNINVLEKAKDLSWQRKIDIREEAGMIGRSCGILKKEHHPANFMDVALYLLSYPPELAYSIALQFSDYKAKMGYSPFPTIMVALGHMDSFYGPMFFRTSLIEERPELMEVLESKEERIKKAGEMLAAAIFGSSRSVKDARTIYHKNTFDPSVKEELDKKLAEYDAEIAYSIMH